MRVRVRVRVAVRVGVRATGRLRLVLEHDEVPAPREEPPRGPRARAQRAVEVGDAVAPGEERRQVRAAAHAGILVQAAAVQRREEPRQIVVVADAVAEEGDARPASAPRPPGQQERDDDGGDRGGHGCSAEVVEHRLVAIEIVTLLIAPCSAGTGKGCRRY